MKLQLSNKGFSAIEAIIMFTIASSIALQSLKLISNLWLDYQKTEQMQQLHLNLLKANKIINENLQNTGKLGLITTNQIHVNKIHNIEQYYSAKNIAYNDIIFGIHPEINGNQESIGAISIVPAYEIEHKNIYICFHDNKITALQGQKDANCKSDLLQWKFTANKIYAATNSNGSHLYIKKLNRNSKKIAKVRNIESLTFIYGIDTNQSNKVDTYLSTTKLQHMLNAKQQVVVKNITYQIIGKTEQPFFKNKTNQEMLLINGSKKNFYDRYNRLNIIKSINL